MLLRLLSVCSLLVVWATGWVAFSLPAQAANVDPYVRRYLRVTDSITLNQDEKGQTRIVSAQDLSNGKRLFDQNCKMCHASGATIPNPSVSLSLADLQGAKPSRSSIEGLVAYMRHPTTYDGTDEAEVCRTVTESWLPQESVEQLAAFILTSAQKIPGWGPKVFD
jgi:photosystem II cytochrome c550